MTKGVSRLPGLEQAAQEMPFDQFGRYHMLREAVDACREPLGAPRLTILDVGGFYEDHGQPTLPLKRFLPADSVTVLDVVECDLPGYVKGDGTALRFDDASFDLVVSADTLEHIPQSARTAFWQELLRVARHGVILLAPFGTPEVEAAEALLFEYIRVELRAEHQQLKEHRDYGLPRLEEWLDLLDREGVAARAYPTGYLHAWLGMMLIKHLLLRVDPGITAQRLLDSYYNRSFFPTERRDPAYRHLIIAEKTPGLVAAVDAVLAPTIMPPQSDASADWGGALQPTLVTVMQRQLLAHHDETARLQTHYQQQVSALERIIADQQIVINQMQEHVVVVNERGRLQVERYEGALRDLLERSQWLEGQAATLRRQLEAVQNGRVMRLLNRLSGRKRS
ncbi:MAG TPA: methyltransferase domain-containing protein [Herpetosiphonaceae bacterium]